MTLLQLEEGLRCYFENAATGKRLYVEKSGNTLVIKTDGKMVVKESQDFPGELTWVWAENEEG